MKLAALNPRLKLWVHPADNREALISEVRGDAPTRNTLNLHPYMKIELPGDLTEVTASIDSSSIRAVSVVPPALDAVATEDSLRRQELLLHRLDLMEAYRCGFYFMGGDKMQLDWSLADFFLRNSFLTTDGSLTNRFAHHKWAATRDFGVIVGAIQDTSAIWRTNTQGIFQPQINLKQLPILCDFIIPDGHDNNAYPGVVLRAGSGAAVRS